MLPNTGQINSEFLATAVRVVSLYLHFYPQRVPLISSVSFYGMCYQDLSSALTYISVRMTLSFLDAHSMHQGTDNYYTQLLAQSRVHLPALPMFIHRLRDLRVTETVTPLPWTPSSCRGQTFFAIEDPSDSRSHTSALMGTFNNPSLRRKENTPGSLASPRLRSCSRRRRGSRTQTSQTCPNAKQKTSHQKPCLRSQIPSEKHQTVVSSLQTSQHVQFCGEWLAYLSEPACFTSPTRTDPHIHPTPSTSGPPHGSPQATYAKDISAFIVSSLTSCPHRPPTNHQRMECAHGLCRQRFTEDSFQRLLQLTDCL